MWAGGQQLLQGSNETVWYKQGERIFNIFIGEKVWLGRKWIQEGTCKLEIQTEEISDYKHLVIYKLTLKACTEIYWGIPSQYWRIRSHGTYEGEFDDHILFIMSY